MCFAAFPRILFFATFLVLLSFWVDLCHQADDEEEEDDEQGFVEALLRNSINRPRSSIADSRICYPFRLIHVGNRQKIVILVKFHILVFLFITTFAVLIWIGMEDNPIESSMVSRRYSCFYLFLSFSCSGFLLYQKMSTVRSERASSEIWKVAGLATLSVLCFTSNSFVALFTNIPVHSSTMVVPSIFTFLV
ncbi:hypothetical protein PVK06_015047 [Gossypium arboreum]|uniref:Uncharacterized protein n=1 Tax=Gossypium arboreum TaxID=29729 RepID=A0ABR0PW72_GOSAR|nr:hypothetical protein PVK06_015047 [Gossypium arboreum]